MSMCVQNVNMPSRIDNVFMFIYTSFLLRYCHFFYLSYCIRMFIFSKTMNKCFWFLKWLAFFFQLSTEWNQIYMLMLMYYIKRFNIKISYQSQIVELYIWVWNYVYYGLLTINLFLLQSWRFPFDLLFD